MEYLEFGLIGLFAICFLSATILPFSSEAVLLLFLSSGYQPLDCLIVATLGNSIGGSTNYFLGRLGNPKWLKRIGFKERNIVKFKTRIYKHGAWMAWLSWVPFIGDPLTIVLGFFRTNIFLTLLFMTLGKLIRYIALLFLAGYWYL